MGSVPLYERQIILTYSSPAKQVLSERGLRGAGAMTRGVGLVMRFSCSWRDISLEPGGSEMLSAR